MQQLNEATIGQSITKQVTLSSQNAVKAKAAIERATKKKIENMTKAQLAAYCEEYVDAGGPMAEDEFADRLSGVMDLVFAYQKALPKKKYGVGTRGESPPQDADSFRVWQEKMSKRMEQLRANAKKRFSSMKTESTMNFPKLQALTEAATVHDKIVYHHPGGKSCEDHADLNGAECDPDKGTVTVANKMSLQSTHRALERAGWKQKGMKQGKPGAVGANDKEYQLGEAKKPKAEPMDEPTDAPVVDKAAVLAFLKDCDAKCRADVKKKLDKMCAADEAAKE